MLKTVASHRRRLMFTRNPSVSKRLFAALPAPIRLRISFCSTQLEPNRIFIDSPNTWVTSDRRQMFTFLSTATGVMPFVRMARQNSLEVPTHHSDTSAGVT